MTDLFVLNLAETLLDIGHRKATGALRITVGGRFRIAFFERGDLVYFVSNLGEESLAASLTRPGRLDGPAACLKLAEAERLVTHKRTLVSLMLELGVCDAAQLQVWLVQYAFECLARAFDAAEGTATMSEGIRADHPLPFSVPVATLVLEGVRRMSNERTIRQAVGPLDYTVEPATNHLARIESLPLAFYDGIVASQVTQRTSLEELVAIVNLPETEVLRAVLALRAVGVLDPFEPPHELTDTGRLRMRRAAHAAGVPVHLDAAVALRMAAEPEPGAAALAVTSGPITMGELDGTAPLPPVPAQATAPVPAHPPVGALRRRGNTAQLNLMASAYRQMAEAEAAGGNFAAAVQYYESALAQAPENLELLTGLAGLFADRPGAQGAAEKLLEKACEAHPNSSVPRLMLARIYRSSGRHAQAEGLLAEVERRDPAAAAEGRARRGEKSDHGHGRGFFSRLRDRSEQPKPAPRAAAVGAPAAESGRKCRHCSGLCPPRATVCRRCGATL
jgi:hypothetical protein